MGADGQSIGFDLEVAPNDRGVIVLVKGDLDIASAPRLTSAVGEIAEGAEPVVLDLEGVTFVDSSGVRALLESERLASEKGRRLALLRPSIAVTRLLDLVDLRDRFPELESADPDALAGLRIT